ncbi:MAG TPA: HDIG domain-containing protein [Candidatus Sumerlaeota bacterium]|nr:HDIG domain-containing protein [Candidatus Sumerlaeota bacterium]
MRDILMKYFPLAAEISDQALREAVLDTFADGLEKGGWKPEDMERIPATLLIPDSPYNLLQHTNSVTACSLAMAREMKKVYGESFHVDMDVIIAGGLLHDVGKLLEIERAPGGGYRKSQNGRILRHPLSGMALAAARGLPDHILHIIACHSKEGDPVRRTTEAIIIHHADFTNFEPFKP